MNKIMPSVIEDNGEYYIHIEEYKTLKELVEHYERLYNEVKKQKDELKKEMDYVDDYNRHLKKQKDDVVEYIKYNATSNYFDKNKNMFRREIDLLRMLGEIDELD